MRHMNQSLKTETGSIHFSHKRKIIPKQHESKQTIESQNSNDEEYEQDNDNVD